MRVVLTRCAGPDAAAQPDVDAMKMISPIMAVSYISYYFLMLKPFFFSILHLLQYFVYFTYAAQYPRDTNSKVGQWHMVNVSLPTIFLIHVYFSLPFLIFFWLFFLLLLLLLLFCCCGPAWHTIVIREPPCFIINNSHTKI